MSKKRGKNEEGKGSVKNLPPMIKHMAEDDQETSMTINNKRVHFITIGGKSDNIKGDPKSFQNRLSSSDEDYDYYQIYEQPRKKYIYPDSELDNIYEEGRNSEA